MLGNEMDDNINSSHKSEEPDQGACFPGGVNKIEDRKSGCGAIGSNGSSNGIHVSCCGTSSAEISTQSSSIPTANSAHGVENIDCNSSIGLGQKNDNIAECSEVLDEDESIEANQMKKRLKLTAPQTGLEMNKGEFGSSLSGLPHGIESTSSDQLVEDEQMAPSCSWSPTEKTMASETRISVKVVEEELLRDASVHCLGHQSSCSNNDGVDESNENKTEICNAIRKDEFTRISSGNCRDTPVHHEGQNTESDADLSLKQCSCSELVASQAVSGSTNVATNGSARKKLLVLDVNGLLVDISSYIPYDYDPDDIIHRKAVFKRPYCDDFLKFCFETFNVGVWTSRTKRNMDPILDFLLGRDKNKLLFSWDQSHCTDTGYYTVEKRHKPLLLKKLKKLWDKCYPDLPWERGAYNEANTLLLDDTPYKALTNPRYTAIFPYSYRFTDVADKSLGPGGDLRVYLEGLAAAENVQEYVRHNPFGQRAITERNLSWRYYLRVIEASTTPPRQGDPENE